MVGVGGCSAQCTHSREPEFRIFGGEVHSQRIPHRLNLGHSRRSSRTQGRKGCGRGFRTIYASKPGRFIQSGRPGQHRDRRLLCRPPPIFNTSYHTVSWFGVGSIQGFLHHRSEAAEPRFHWLKPQPGYVGDNLFSIRETTLPVRMGDVLILATDTIYTEFADALPIEGKPRGGGGRPFG